MTLLVSAPVLAAPAPFDGSQSIDAWNGLVMSFSRATGLGGAYVGVAEGQDDAVFNPAATTNSIRLYEIPAPTSAPVGKAD